MTNKVLFFFTFTRRVFVKKTIKLNEKYLNVVSLVSQLPLAPVVTASRSNYDNGKSVMFVILLIEKSVLHWAKCC